MEREDQGKKDHKKASSDCSKGLMKSLVKRATDLFQNQGQNFEDHPLNAMAKASPGMNFSALKTDVDGTTS